VEKSIFASPVCCSFSFWPFSRSRSHSWVDVPKNFVHLEFLFSLFCVPSFHPRPEEAGPSPFLLGFQLSLGRRVPPSRFPLCVSSSLFELCGKVLTSPLSGFNPVQVGPSCSEIRAQVLHLRVCLVFRQLIPSRKALVHLGAQCSHLDPVFLGPVIGSPVNIVHPGSAPVIVFSFAVGIGSRLPCRPPSSHRVSPVPLVFSIRVSSNWFQLPCSPTNHAPGLGFC
jgi:hypothetical protein